METWKQKRWLRITTYTILALIIFSVGASTGTEKTVEVQDTSRIEKLAKENRQLKNDISGIQDELDSVKVDDGSCETALESSIEINVELNNLVTDFARAVQAYMESNSLNEIKQVVEDQNAIYEKLPALARKVEKCTGRTIDL